MGGMGWCQGFSGDYSEHSQVERIGQIAFCEDDQAAQEPGTDSRVEVKVEAIGGPFDATVEHGLQQTVRVRTR